MSWQPLGMLLDSPGGGQALNPSEGTKLPSDPGLRTLAASKKYAREMHRYPNCGDSQWFKWWLSFPDDLEV